MASLIYLARNSSLGGLACRAMESCSRLQEISWQWYVSA